MTRGRRGAARGPHAAPGRVRIIGGRWRGTRLDVEPVDGLRPTADRTRETLFNWLQPVLPGSRCLDLFAGSGALGLEAASRGAGEVVLVEREPRQAARLLATVERLQAGPVEVVCADALAWLRQPRDGCFDVVFLDPPFATRHWPTLFGSLRTRLAADAWVYVEAAVDQPPEVPGGWALHRSTRSREACARLYRVSGDAADTLGTSTATAQDRSSG